jgi:hypothetical protein
MRFSDLPATPHAACGHARIAMGWTPELKMVFGVPLFGGKSL